MNTPSTVDADYRGEIKVILVNLLNENVTIEKGNRIAQMVIQKVGRTLLQEVKMINETERNSGRFCHTGKA